MGADTFKASVQLKTAVQQTLGSDTAPAASATTITWTDWDFTHSLSATSTPPLSKHAAFQQALTDGAATIDLTALDGLGGASIDGTGLKVQALKLRNPSTNSGSISIAPGAANGYDFLGSDMKLTLQPGDEVLLYAPDTADEIGATDKTLDLAGTGSEALDVEILMG